MTDQSTGEPVPYGWPPAIRGVEAKVRRAREQTDELKKDINGFVNSDRHRFSHKANDDGTEYVGWIYFDPIPDTKAWGVIVGEILHDLRSALNALVWQLVKANGKQPDLRTEFPIFKDRERFLCDAGPKIRGVSDVVRAKIEAIQPFQFGENAHKAALWILHDANNTDKHRLVLPVVNALRSSRRSTELPPGARLKLSPTAEHGAPISRILLPEPTPEMKVQIETTYKVSLRLSGIIYEIGQILAELGREVEGTTIAFFEEFS